MADVTVTDTAVFVADSVRVSSVEAGAVITAGKVLVYDPVDQDYILASNSTLALSGNGGANQIVLAVGGVAAAGQRISVVGAGVDVTLGGGLTTGRVYVLSASGAISPESDNTTNDWVTIIGYAKSSTVLFFNPQSTGIQIQ